VILLAVRWYLRYGLSYRDVAAARRFFATALSNHERPAEITTDLAAPLLRVVDELIPKRFMTPSNTRTTGSRTTTAASRRG